MRQKYDGFESCYGISKVIRTGLIPQGATLEHIEKKGLLLSEEKRAEDYTKVKKIIDRYHRKYIDNQLKDAELSGVEESYSLYCKTNRTEKENTDLKKDLEKLRKQVSNFLTSSDEFKRIDKKELIEKDLLNFVQGDEEEEELVKSFKGFTTYFKGFHENRKNMYSHEEKSTAIAYRVINQNMFRYFDNIRSISKFILANSENNIAELESIYSDKLKGKTLEEFFSVDNYSFFISQSGIDTYNMIIGGYSVDERTKVKGINEYINLFNQENHEKFGTLKPLYKQILAERTTESFLPEKFENDKEVIESLAAFSHNMSDTLLEIMEVFGKIGEYDASGIYLKYDSLKDISTCVFSDWSAITNALWERYDVQYIGKKKKETKAYIEEKRKHFKNLKSVSADEINTAMGENVLIPYSDAAKSLFEKICVAEENIRELINLDYPDDKELSKDKAAVKDIKAYLDSVKALQHHMKPLLGNQDESGKNEFFYGDFSGLWDELDALTPLYNKVRNYVTKKPYSTEKIKLNFDNSTLLNGWDLNKEEANTAILMQREGFLYLGIMDKKHNKIFRNIENTGCEDCYQKMEYKLLPGANKMLPKVFFSKKGIESFKPPLEILEIYKNETFKKGDAFNIDDCHTIIDFYKKALNEHEDWKKFEFKFSKTKDYRDISEFYREVEAQGYKISFKAIPKKIIDEYVEKGWLYLFKIWNKDFSEYSKGTPNLHTLYLKMLFDPRNLENVVYKLNGEAEIFYRKASIQPKDIIKHPANEAIKNKNPLNKKQSSIFKYDLIKDRRYTVDKFEFHVPITLNFKARGKENINTEVREYIKRSKNLYVIGVDRGERNLLYVSVVDADGSIVEQYSLNDIVNEYKGVQYRTDYHALLDTKEKNRDKARKEWTEIQNIKELKEGYISQVVHKICELMMKYEAIIALEDLNGGFKNSRKKVEKQVYQKFEKMLIEKLNYLVDKKADVNEPSGLLHALQLTSKFEGFNKLFGQSGFVFYVPAWNTSNIDPCTGFTNLFFSKDLRYSGVENSLEFWKKFDSVAYDDTKDIFSFTFDYNNFNQRAEEIKSKSKWTVYSYGDRLETFRNADLNQQYDSREVKLTEAFKELFKKYEIPHENCEIKENILNCKERDFHDKLLHLFKLTLQLRNSKTGTMIDYMTSPVMSVDGNFFDSRTASSKLPQDADANGAYNIARKGLWLIEKLKNTKDADLPKAKLAIKNAEWLAYAQRNENNG